MLNYVEMGSIDGIMELKAYDVEDTIFVAVGKNVEKSKTTLFWAVQSFAGKKICVLHVQQSDNAVSLSELPWSRFNFIDLFVHPYLVLDTSQSPGKGKEIPTCETVFRRSDILELVTIRVESLKLNAGFRVCWASFGLIFSFWWSDIE